MLARIENGTYRPYVFVRRDGFILFYIISFSYFYDSCFLDKKINLAFNRAQFSQKTRCGIFYFLLLDIL